MIQLGNTAVTNVKTSGTLTAGSVTYPSSHGTPNQFLTTSGSGTLTWTSPTSISIGAIGTATTNGASIASGVLSLTPADGTNGGIVTTGTQTIAGAKTFTDAPILTSTSASQALFTDANKNIVSNAITGTGNVVMSNSPTLVTPNIGAATGSSINISGSVTADAVTAKKYIAIIPTATTAAATTEIDLSTGNIFKINLGANITTLNLNNITAGTYILEFIQGGTFTVTFPTTNWKWSGGTAPTITATNGKTDIVTIVYDGATYFASAIQNF